LANSSALPSIRGGRHRCPRGTPAAKASVKAGDNHRGIAGKKVSSPTTQESSKNGHWHRQHMAVVREGKPVTLDVGPAETAATMGWHEAAWGPGGKHDSSGFASWASAETLTAEWPAAGGQTGTWSGYQRRSCRQVAALAGLGTQWSLCRANRKPVARWRSWKRFSDDSLWTRGAVADQSYQGRVSSSSAPWVARRLI